MTAPRILLVALLTLGLAACSSTPDESATGDTAGQADGMGGTADPNLGTVPVGGVQSNPLGSATPGSQEELRQTVGDTVLFGTDRSDLSPEARAILDRQADWLLAYPNLRVVVEGHADERGTREYNLALGERRAAAARSYLVALGVGADRITVVSYGKERPVALGTDEGAWRLNRRAVTVVE